MVQEVTRMAAVYILLLLLLQIMVGEGEMGRAAKGLCPVDVVLPSCPCGVCVCSHQESLK